MSKPVIAVTMGDAAGIGPEIIVKALSRPEIYAICKPLVIGDSSVLERARRITGKDIAFHVVGSVGDGRFAPGFIDLLDLQLLPDPPAVGKLSKEAGNAAFRYIEKAVQLGLQGDIQAICTAPLNKAALHMGGHQYPGHTEILADLMNVQNYSMMLASPKLRVIHVTTHIGLLDAIRIINPERVYTVIRLAHEMLVRSGVAKPKISVCGINPHAGEGGLFGYGEEEEKIVPAVERAAGEGIDAVGPLPADTLFYRAARGDFDVVVAMYHDQGHGPIKVLGLEAGVNITVGLPVVRTSVDHGTAFDIAGRGIADETSLMEALKQAAALAPK
ncbi:4-hydroxythreonine-4-phosphate dehydrogenase PdxA [Ferviditalea candida]|uniref:4-hydroxythreonine-4-phosphate dehydrogenase PdxA n=1 Tax=Ferviditalea candida TaxID=3108399 RepID=A0ABU5ZDL6_9BACL|nr:4-hydroxythreonine-4-phosphate dehydrogenase PdxA [Paenibacillaceae bacterium T2]